VGHRPSAVHGLREIVVNGLLDINGRHHAVPLRIHIGTHDAVHVEYGDVKSRLVRALRLPVEGLADALADGVVLVFERAVDTPVGGIHRQAAQMPGQAIDAADQVPREVHFQQFGRKGEVDVTAFEIDGDALHVERALFARQDRAGQFA